MPQEVKKVLSGRSYYDNTIFDNVVLSSIIAIDGYIQDLLFPNDPSRIVIAKNEFAFRRRFQFQIGNENSEIQVNSLNMPFLNFAPKDNGIKRDTERVLKSHALEVTGFYVPELSRRMKLTPLHIDFESTFFSTEESDVHYVMSKMQWQMSEEILLKPVLEIEGVEFSNYGCLVINGTDYNSIYKESDFLKENRIKTIGMDFGIDTYLPNFHDASSKVYIPKKILFSFTSSHNITDWDYTDYDKLFSGKIDHEKEEVTIGDSSLPIDGSLVVIDDSNVGWYPSHDTYDYMVSKGIIDSLSMDWNKDGTLVGTSYTSMDTLMDSCTYLTYDLSIGSIKATTHRFSTSDIADGSYSLVMNITNYFFSSTGTALLDIVIEGGKIRT